MTTATLTRPLTTTLVADVVSGDALPVAGIDVHVDYCYPHGAARRRRSITDGDGRAVLVDRHPAPPVRVAVRAAGESAVVEAAAAMAVVVEV